VTIVSETVIIGQEEVVVVVVTLVESKNGAYANNLRHLFTNGRYK
jgi:hypothetical protein